MKLPARYTRPALILLVALAIYAWHRGRYHDRIPWRENLASASAEARQTGKPLLLYFTSPSCGPCDILERTTWSDAAVTAELAKYIPVKLDIDYAANQALAAHYDPQGIPLTVLLDSNGNLIRSNVGALSPEEFLEWLKGQL